MVSKNLHRRHLTAEWRRQRVAELRTKGMSTREIADKVGATHTTVQKDLKAGGNNFPPAEDVEDDQPRPTPTAKPASASPPSKVTGRDGKQYPAERPKTPPPTPTLVPPAGPKTTPKPLPTAGCSPRGPIAGPRECPVVQPVIVFRAPSAPGGMHRTGVGFSDRTPPHRTIAMPTVTLPSPTDVDNMSVFTLVTTARSLGFSFSPSPKGVDEVIVTPPSRPGANAPLVLALARRMRDPAVADMVVDVATAAGLQTSPLRSSPPPPPKKIGHNPDGTRFTLPDLPPTPAPPPRQTPTICEDFSTLRSVADCDVFIQRAELGLRVATTSLSYLPGETEDEPHEVAERRSRLHGQIGLLGDHLYHLNERRSELFMEYVDDAAMKRAQVEADAKHQDWMRGRTSRPC